MHKFIIQKAHHCQTNSPTCTLLLGTSHGEARMLEGNEMPSMIACFDRYMPQPQGEAETQQEDQFYMVLSSY